MNVYDYHDDDPEPPLGAAEKWLLAAILLLGAIVAFSLAGCSV